MDPALEEASLRKRAEQQRLINLQENFDKVLLDLDKAMDSYATAMLNSDFQRAERRATGIYEFIGKAVAKHFDSLVHAADDTTKPLYRARAVGALGFSERPEALDPLLNAVRDSDPVVATNAAFALGILKDPRTPPSVLADRVEDASLSNRERLGSANSLFQLQGALHDPSGIYPVWQRVLGEPAGEVDPFLLVVALRGLSRSRDAQHAKLAEGFIAHPTPMVREMSAICLGYLGDRDSHVVLLTRLEPQENNPNVRLAARKALQALAGNIDRGYDVGQWRKVFQTRNG